MNQRATPMMRSLWWTTTSKNGTGRFFSRRPSRPWRHWCCWCCCCSDCCSSAAVVDAFWSSEVSPAECLLPSRLCPSRRNRTKSPVCFACDLTMHNKNGSHNKKALISQRFTHQQQRRRRRRHTAMRLTKCAGQIRTTGDVVEVLRLHLLLVRLSMVEVVEVGHDDGHG